MCSEVKVYNMDEINEKKKVRHKNADSSRRTWVTRETKVSFFVSRLVVGHYAATRLFPMTSTLKPIR